MAQISRHAATVVGLDRSDSEIVVGASKPEKGYLVIPDAPGIGVELAEDAQERYPYRPHRVRTRLHEDRSVFDQ